MNGAQTLCAPSARFKNWSAIPWPAVEKKVERLQRRIAKAIREGKYGKAKALSWILTHSYYAKLLAIKRVVNNKGKNTPGVDGILWNTPTEKMQAVDTLKRHAYKPLPLRRIYIPKKNGKKRPLGIPTMRDRAMQAVHALALKPIAETLADINSYGFREERCCHDAIQQLFNCLAKSYSAQWVLDADIKACFDGISHKWLIENIPMDKRMLTSWLKAGYVEDKEFFPTKEGTPQGGIISPILANMTLDGLETAIRKAVNLRADKVNVIRYADDFVTTGISEKLLRETVVPTIKRFLKPRGLQLSEEKTHITHIDNGFDFLGQNIRKYNGKLLIKPSKKAVKSVVEKARGAIKTMRTAKTEALIMKLNSIVRGWVNYHRFVVATDSFSYVEHILCKQLKRWAYRRHPNKGWKWVWQNYFTAGLKPGTLSAKVRTKNGKYKTYHLFTPTSTPIMRFIKVRQVANPYDPEFSEYFRLRKSRKQVLALSRQDVYRSR